MLRELQVRNLAVIEDASLCFEKGLEVFTGQTGAGKSLLLGALRATTGGGLKPMMRNGADESAVTALFDVTDASQCETLREILDVPLSVGGELVLTTRLQAGKRQSWRVNGQPVARSVLSEAAPWLIDIHGQHDTQRLMRASEQLVVLDSFANLTKEREQCQAHYRKWKELEAKYSELESQMHDRNEKLAFLRFQCEELDKVSPKANEYFELRAIEKRLGSVSQLREDCNVALVLLQDGDGSQTPILSQLQSLRRILENVAETDEQGQSMLSLVKDADISLRELNSDLQRWSGHLDEDPILLENTRQRLGLLDKLIRRYGRGEDDMLSMVVEAHERMLEEISQLEMLDLTEGDLKRDLAAVQKAWRDIAKVMTLKRQKSAELLRPQVEAILKELGMAHAQFRVTIFDSDQPSAFGQDSIVFEVKTNAGGDWSPLSEVASGGELSRVLLALKEILCNDLPVTMVFDELDASIGGRLGDVMGRKLQSLAQAQGQVLCITHLPQMAAFANNHHRIEKQTIDRGGKVESVTRVCHLDSQQQIEELALMLAGGSVSDTTRKQARELVSMAQKNSSIEDDKKASVEKSELP